MRSDIETFLDRRMGNVNELQVIQYLNKYEPDPYVFCDGRYNFFDFENSNDKCELKSRRNNYNRYPTTMVGYNKVKIAEEDDTLNYKFFFLFRDGLYVWEFKKDEYTIKYGGIKENIKPYCYIPIDKLKLVSTQLSSV